MARGLNWKKAAMLPFFLCVSAGQAAASRAVESVQIDAVFMQVEKAPTVEWGRRGEHKTLNLIFQAGALRPQQVAIHQGGVLLGTFDGEEVTVPLTGDTDEGEPIVVIARYAP